MDIKDLISDFFYEIHEETKKTLKKENGFVVNTNAKSLDLSDISKEDWKKIKQLLFSTSHVDADGYTTFGISWLTKIGRDIDAATRGIVLPQMKESIRKRIGSKFPEFTNKFHEILLKEQQNKFGATVNDSNFEDGFIESMRIATDLDILRDISEVITTRLLIETILSDVSLADPQQYHKIMETDNFNKLLDIKIDIKMLSDGLSRSEVIKEIKNSDWIKDFIEEVLTKLMGAALQIIHKIVQIDFFENIDEANIQQAVIEYTKAAPDKFTKKDQRQFIKAFEELRESMVKTDDELADELANMFLERGGQTKDNLEELTSKITGLIEKVKSEELEEAEKISEEEAIKLMEEKLTQHIEEIKNLEDFVMALLKTKVGGN